MAEDTAYMYENFTGSEIAAVEVYREQWREFNGGAEPSLPHHCHCGAPLDDGACECAACTAEWQEFMNEAADVRGNLHP